MTAVMSVYLLKLAFRKFGFKGVLFALILPITVIGLLVSFAI